MTITNDLDDLMAGFCNIGKGFDAEYLVKEGFDDVGLVTIFVPEDYRRRGHARWFMERFIAILDKYGRGAKVMASEKDGCDLDGLVGFYGEFDFYPILDKEGIDSDGYRQRWLRRSPNELD